MAEQQPQQPQQQQQPISAYEYYATVQQPQQQQYARRQQQPEKIDEALLQRVMCCGKAAWILGAVGMFCNFFCMALGAIIFGCMALEKLKEPSVVHLDKAYCQARAGLILGITNIVVVTTSLIIGISLIVAGVIVLG